MREWLKGLTHSEDRKRIGVDIATIEFGWPIGMPVCRSLGGGIYEVPLNIIELLVCCSISIGKGAWFYCTAS